MIPANPLLSLNPFHSNPGVDQIQPAFFYHSSGLIMMATP